MTVKETLEKAMSMNPGAVLMSFISDKGSIEVMYSAQNVADIFVLEKCLSINTQKILEQKPKES